MLSADTTVSEQCRKIMHYILLLVEVNGIELLQSQLRFLKQVTKLLQT